MNAGNALSIHKSWVQHGLLTCQAEHYLPGVSEPFQASLIHPWQLWVCKLFLFTASALLWHQVWYQCHPSHPLLMDRSWSAPHTSLTLDTLRLLSQRPFPFLSISHKCSHFLSHFSHPLLVRHLCGSAGLSPQPLRAALCPGLLLSCFIYFFLIFIYLAAPVLSCSMWDLQSSRQHVTWSSLTRDGTRAPCNGSSESQPLGHQGSPLNKLLENKYLDNHQPVQQIGHNADSPPRKNNCWY